MIIPDETKSFLAKKLGVIRLALSLKQTEIIQILGVSRPTYIRIERGTKKMNTIIARSLILLILHEKDKNQMLDDIICELPEKEMLLSIRKKVPV